ncbi:toll-like receptor 4 [Physella acuta]|uniref:toll-like receptor 4 n=1 Tax=Physella acuta TaxID=109671 RepID=UPI0027DB35D0|nr:toll-like receptor 4 [Physella acuta]
MHTNAFSGLTYLAVLNLEYNALEFDNNSYPDGIFSPLINLKELYLKRDQDCTKSEYPSCFLCPLTNLTTLSIDSVGETVNFGPEFNHQARLKRLVLWVCSSSIIENTFIRMNQLTVLEIYGYYSLSNFSDMALTHLPLLDTFILSMTHLGTAKVLEIFKPLVGRSMSVISLNSVYLAARETVSSHHMQDGVLDAEKTKYLLQICVRRFEFTRSFLRILEQDALFSETCGWLKINISFVGMENVEYVDARDNGFNQGYGKCEGLTGLKTLLGSGNDFAFFSPTSFDSISAVENLALANCRFDVNNFQLNSLRIFRNLKSLKRLDLSLNALTFLAENTFSTNPNMTELYLATNRFTKIPFNLKLTPNLQVLDLSENAISTLDEAITMELDELAVKNGKFSLRLAGNVLSCGCENFSFIKWILTTIVEIDFDSILMCVNESGLYSHLDKHWDVGTFWRQCVGQQYLYISVVILCVIAIIFLVSFVVIRCKLYIVAYVAQILGTVPRRRLTDFQNHVFIVSSPNENFVTVLSNYLKQTFFLNTRDFRDLEPGRPEYEDLFAEINTTWRVILVVTDEFFHDNNFQMLYTLVLNSMSHDNPGKVLLLYERNVQLNVDLINAIGEDNILEVPLWQLTPNIDEFLYDKIFIEW